MCSGTRWSDQLSGSARNGAAEAAEVGSPTGTGLEIPGDVQKLTLVFDLTGQKQLVALAEHTRLKLQSDPRTLVVVMIVASE